MLSTLNMLYNHRYHPSLELSHHPMYKSLHSINAPNPSQPPDGSVPESKDSQYLVYTELHDLYSLMPDLFQLASLIHVAVYITFIFLFFD